MEKRKPLRPFLKLDERTDETIWQLTDVWEQSVRASHDFLNEKVNRVDVNEQNPKALRFYERCGFTVYQRDEIDGQGNPFPILRMRLNKDAL